MNIAIRGAKSVVPAQSVRFRDNLGCSAKIDGAANERFVKSTWRDAVVGLIQKVSW